LDRPEKQAVSTAFGTRKPLKRLVSTIAEFTGLKAGVNETYQRNCVRAQNFI
jgi:hypothetical protein